MKNFARLTALAVILATSSIPTYASADEENPQKAVLITGATTGIGRYAAERLAEAGYFVYAGARKDADIEELNQIDNIMAVRLDVTKQDQIDAAVALVEEQGRGLWGIVNNAGVNVVAPLIEASESDFQFLFDVNVFGVFRVTKGFAPMILESKGRIVNISSISGVLSGGGYGMYAGSKHALEAMTDALAQELAPFDVHVSAVNPGNFASEIGLSRCKRLVNDNNAEDWGLFEDRRQEMIDSCKERLDAGVQSEGTPPDAVARAIEQALFEDNPRERYLVVPRQVEAGWTIAKAIDELLVLNAGHEHSYTRDELVQYLDRLLPYIDGSKSTDDEAEDAELRAFFQKWATRGEEVAED